MNVKEGEFVSIMGPSGSGKSTLLHILGLLEEPSEGEYLFLDEPVQQLSEKKRTELHRHHIGFVFQAYHLIDELTVYENIETPLLYKGTSSAERKSRVAELLDRFNMVAKKDLFPQPIVGWTAAISWRGAIYRPRAEGHFLPTNPPEISILSKLKTSWSFSRN